MRLDDVAVAAAPWPATTAFGLRSAVAIAQWCWLHDDGQKACFVRGGAGWCAPWQGCGEFLLLVRCMIALVDAFESHVTTHALRPVLRLA